MALQFINEPNCSPTDPSGSRFVELTVIGKDERFLR